ncbi:MAG: hypothetical protein LBB76_12485, partial [Azoarcus sp.]|nr:hypothetical protein [Azoarcus sp.]
MLNGWGGSFILDAVTGTILRELKGYNAIFSPDGRYALARSGESAMLWQVDTGQLRLQLEGATGCFVFSPDGSLVLSADSDKNSVCLWEISSGRKRFEVHRQKSSYPPGVSSLAFAPDGARCFVCFRSEAAYIWDVESGRELLRLEG